MKRSLVIAGLAVLASAALSVALSVGGSAGAADEPAWTDSGPERVSVLELFTSEGCSSCPSAEKWIGKLRTHPELWKRVVPLNFHVDYWDRLGWPDKFAEAAHTQRQYRHVENLGLGSAYTPGFILEGREWRDFFKPRRQVPEFAPGPEVGSLRVREVATGIDVEFQPVGKADDDYVVYASVLGFDVSNEIRAGENRGRTLVQNFVVLGVSQAKAGTEDGRLRVTLPAPVRAKDRPAEHAIVAWVERPGDPTPLQAVGYGVSRTP